MPTLRMVAPRPDFTRVSVEGFVYDVKDGEIDAHVQHQVHLEGHGFTVKTERDRIEIKTEVDPKVAAKAAADKAAKEAADKVAADKAAKAAALKEAADKKAAAAKEAAEKVAADKAAKEAADKAAAEAPKETPPKDDVLG